MMEYIQLNEAGFADESGYLHCHICNPETGEYVGPSDEYISMHTGLPGWAFLDGPAGTPREGFVWTRHGSVWTETEDHRGKTAYHTETKEPRLVTELGPVSAPETLLQPSSHSDHWDGKQWVADPDAEAAAALAAAAAKRNALLAEANQHIAVLSDAVDLGMATADEQAAYTAWRRYRVELTRLDLTVTPIAWPEKPQ